MLIDWFTVAAQAVNFLILVWLLKRFLYKPVLAALEEREMRIAAQLQDAERKKAEALKEQTDFQRKNEEFDGQRSGLLLEATKAATTERERLLETARKDSGELRDALRKGVLEERDKLNAKIEVLAREEVFAIARKVLADLADANLEERITGLFIRRLHDLEGKQREELKVAFHDAAEPVLIRSAFALAPAQKTAIEEAVKPLLGEGMGIVFEMKPDLIGGIELAAKGRKIAWNVADYLTSLTDSVNGLMEAESHAV